MSEGSTGWGRRRPWRGRILVLAGILAVAFTLRSAVTVVPPVAGAIGQDIPMPSWLLGVLGMLPTALFGLGGLATPALMRRTGPEALAVGAMGAAALGQVLRGAAPESGLFLAGTAIALAGMGAGNVVLPPLVKKYFPDRPGVLTALYVTVLSLGTAVPPALAVPVADAAGWRTSLAWWAALNLLAALPWLGLLPRWRHDGGESPRAGRAPAVVRGDGGDAPGAAGPRPRITPPPPPAGPVRVWRSPTAWALALVFGCTSLNTYAMFAWIPSVFADAGLPPHEAGLQLALFSALGLPLSLLVPLLASRLRSPWPIVVAGVVCFAAGYAGLWLAPGAAPSLWSALTGLGPATFPLALLLVNLRTRTQRVSGALSGFSQGVGYTLACLGPVLTGWLHDATGEWAASFAFLGATLAVLAVAGWVVSRRGFVDDDEGVVAAP